MSRLSRANLKARESVFGAGSEIYRGEIQATCPASLSECVMALEDCCEEAYEAQNLLRNGTQDLLRMSKVLDNQRIFLLVNESTVKRYKAEIADEVEPQITELLRRAEQGLEALVRKETLLQNKRENAKLNPQRAGGGTTSAQRLEARRHHLLVKQRERLEEELKALKAEVEELERNVVED
ncbi:hypothetical protein M378DRAFT_189929 [Amanita muscaria Koide BX008]|uniref:DASH complex subunit SPC19 n=1 Tax=Amanita muscaria (strain Koide BX008) TaxID=946122 RepID=A0A0C2TSZ4_AMAMK|nr:hypothetical protein M378DRAFT_189929 [Amanita muscaria Koide BX008]